MRILHEVQLESGLSASVTKVAPHDSVSVFIEKDERCVAQLAKARVISW